MVKDINLHIFHVLGLKENGIDLSDIATEGW